MEWPKAVNWFRLDRTLSLGWCSTATKCSEWICCTAKWTGQSIWSRTNVESNVIFVQRNNERHGLNYFDKTQRQTFAAFRFASCAWPKSLLEHMNYFLCDFSLPSLLSSPNRMDTTHHNNCTWNREYFIGEILIHFNNDRWKHINLPLVISILST